MLASCPHHLKHCLPKARALCSFFDMQGGQALMTIVIGGPFGEVKVEGFTFAIVDSQNGDIADAPPNGHASAQALTLAPEQIDATVHRLQRSGLVVAAVMCGQGLKQHSAAIHRRLADLQLAREPAGAQVSCAPNNACIYRYPPPRHRPSRSSTPLIQPPRARTAACPSLSLRRRMQCMPPCYDVDRSESMRISILAQNRCCVFLFVC